MFTAASLIFIRFQLTDHREFIMQGQELEVLRSAAPFKRIIYCGDGANDLCPALALLPSDYVLARKVIPCPQAVTILFPMQICFYLGHALAISCPISGSTGQSRVLPACFTGLMQNVVAVQLQ